MEYNSEDMAGGDNISIHAGFPNPAASAQSSLSLDQLLIRHPSSSYLFRIRGHAQEGHGIYDGDIALIDRAVTPGKQDLVISWHDDSFTLTQLHKLPKGLEPWGTVRAIIHSYH